MRIGFSVFDNRVQRAFRCCLKGHWTGSIASTYYTAFYIMGWRCTIVSLGLAKIEWLCGQCHGQIITLTFQAFLGSCFRINFNPTSMLWQDNLPGLYLGFRVESTLNQSYPRVLWARQWDSKKQESVYCTFCPVDTLMLTIIISILCSLQPIGLQKTRVCFLVLPIC